MRTSADTAVSLSVQSRPKAKEPTVEVEWIPSSIWPPCIALMHKCATHADGLLFLLKSEPHARFTAAKASLKAPLHLFGNYQLNSLILCVANGEQYRQEKDQRSLLQNCTHHNNPHSRDKGKRDK